MGLKKARYRAKCRRKRKKEGKEGSERRILVNFLLGDIIYVYENQSLYISRV